MGTMTGPEIATLVRGNLGNRSSTDVPDATLLWFVNWTLLHLASPRVYRHRELQETRSTTLVTGTALYNIVASGSPALAVDSVVIAHPTDSHRRRRLDPMRDRDAFDISGVMTASEPQWYAKWGETQIELLPAPGSTYNAWNLHIRYLAPPTLFVVGDMGSGTTTTPYSPLWDEVVVQGATWRGWRWLREWERAEQAKGEFGQLINETASRVDVEAEDNDFGPPLVLAGAM